MKGDVHTYWYIESIIKKDEHLWREKRRQSSPYWYCCPTLASGHRPWSHCCWFDIWVFTHSYSLFNSWRLYGLTIRHHRHDHSIIQYWWCLSTLTANSVEKICVNHPPHCILHKPLSWPQLNILAFWAVDQVVYWLSASVKSEDGPRSRSHSWLFSGLIVDCCHTVNIWCTKQSGLYCWEKRQPFDYYVAAFISLL